MRIAPSSERGFSLLEAIVVVGIVATALVTLAHLMATSVASGATARHITLATIFAAEKIEQLRMERQLEPIVDGFEYLASTGAVYERRWTISPLSSTPEVMLISVSVGHPTRGQHNVRLTTARARVRE